MKRFMFCLLVFLFPLFCISAISSAAEEYIQARVFIDSPEMANNLKPLHLDVIRIDRGYIEIVTNNIELNEIMALGYKVEIIHSDMVAFYQSRLLDKDMGGFMTLSDIEFEQLILHATYPNITSERTSIGLSIEGRDIWAMKISDNPEIDEEEPAVLFTGAIHAREVITPHVVIHIMNYLAENYGTDPYVTNLVNNREIWFVPCVNPDGYFHNQIISPAGGGMWRKTRRDNGDGSFGVDLNRNFGYEWGHDDVGSSPSGSDQAYRGTAPFSEPESQALRDLTINNDIKIAAYFHSSGDLYLWPWSYSKMPSPDEDLFRSMADSMSVFSGFEPVYMPEVDGLGYTANGTVTDWYYGDQISKNMIPAFTIEVGNYTDGFWPDPGRIDTMVAEHIAPSLYMIDLADNVYRALKPDISEIISPDSVGDGEDFSVEWTHFDTLNPAVSFELTEMTGPMTVIDNSDTHENWISHNFSRVDNLAYFDNTSFYGGAVSTKAPILLTSKYPYLVQPADTFRFMTFYEISEGWDYAYVEISIDGINFESIPGNITTDNPGPWGKNFGHGITGHSNGEIIEAIFDISAYEGYEVYFRFFYNVHDRFYAWNGIWIDDINPVQSFENITILAEDETGLSFNVNGKQGGFYTYQVRAKDGDGQTSDYSEMFNIKVGSGIAFICGDVNNDLEVNLIDILYLIDYKYGIPPGPEPIPLNSANVNNDEDINLIDILYLIDYKYAIPPGPDPACP